MLTLAPVTLEDARDLFVWRNDPATRENSFSSDLVEYPEHLEWLTAAMKNPKREVLIARAGERAVGVVRLDRTESGTELSWTVAPEARGLGYGRQMVAMAAERIDGPVFARIKPGNVASIKIALSIGLNLVDSNGVLTFSRGSVG